MIPVAPRRNVERADARGKARRGGPRRPDPDELVRAQHAAEERLTVLARKLQVQEAELARLAAERAMIIARLDAVERAATGTGKGRV